MDPLIKSQLLYQLSYAPADQGKPRHHQGALHTAQRSFVQPLKAAPAQMKLPERVKVPQNLWPAPFASGILRCLDQSASTDTVPWGNPWPRWTSARLEPE